MVTAEILTTLIEYAYDLQGEWSWKRGECNGNAEEYVQLGQDIEKAIALRNQIETLNKHE